MKRIIDHYLRDWKNDLMRKPLLLRGARQVGKTYAARTLGATFKNCVEINFEKTPQAHKVFELDLDPHRIVLALSALSKQPIVPGQTLLFFDEIQAAPLALTALRYFYEELPALHVIGAGSLLDFTIERIGIPVGRVTSLHMYPLSFIEFLVASGNQLLAKLIYTHEPEIPINEALHQQALYALGTYFAIGGMPEAITTLHQTNNSLKTITTHQDILTTYRQDFTKYSSTLQVKYVELLFDQIPQQLSRKFKYSLVDGDYRKRELAPALDALVTAGVAHKVHHATASALPLSAGLDTQDYKALFLDIALAHTSLGLNNAEWFINPIQEISVKGPLVEAFVGQELLTYSSPHKKESLFYWHKESRLTSAEIDYVIERNQSIIPIEVKASAGKTLRSIKHFLETHKESSYGLRFSSQNYSIYENIHSYPLYAVASATIDKDSRLNEAIQSLFL